MKTITQQELDAIITKHELALEGDLKGQLARFIEMDLSGLDFSGRDLSYAVFKNVRLERASFARAKFIKSQFYNVNIINTECRKVSFKESNFYCTAFFNSTCSESDFTLARFYECEFKSTYYIKTIFDYARFSYANIKNCDLSQASFIRTSFCSTWSFEHNKCYGSNFTSADFHNNIINITSNFYDELTTGFALACPEEGSFIGYKKAQGYVIKLLILEDALRSSATSRKCRCSKAKVLGIYNQKRVLSKRKNIASNFDSNFVYSVGKIVQVSNFDTNRWNECSTGIHFFLTFDEAVKY